MGRSGGRAEVGWRKKAEGGGRAEAGRREGGGRDGNE